MADFRSLLAELGYTGVTTLLNSGNAVFDAAGGTGRRHALDIASAMVKKLNVDVPVIVKSAKEFSLIVENNPIITSESEHSRLLVAFTQSRQAIPALVAAIEPLVAPPDQFAAGRCAAYLLCASGILKSQAGAALLGKAGAIATTRNWATTLKLNALAGGASI